MAWISLEGTDVNTLNENFLKAVLDAANSIGLVSKAPTQRKALLNRDSDFNPMCADTFHQLLQKKNTDDLASVTNNSKFWPVVRAVKRVTVFVPPLPVSDWDHFYQNLYPPRISGVAACSFNNEVHELDQPITSEKIVKSLRKIKKRESAGLWRGFQWIP